jgi:hypothetical protein
MARYSIVSMNNAEAGRGGARLERGEFDDAEAALAHAKRLVDAALEQLGAISSPHEMMMQYTRRGSEVPMIFGEPRVTFHAYQYAREKVEATFATLPLVDEPRVRQQAQEAAGPGLPARGSAQGPAPGEPAFEASGTPDTP